MQPKLRKIEITHKPTCLKIELSQLKEAINDATWDGDIELLDELVKRKQMVELKIALGETHEVAH